MKKFLKKVGFGLLGLLILLLVIGFLLPSERRIEASVRINAPMQLVFEQVNDLRNWEKWSPWKAIDPLMEMSYSNPPAGKGAFLNWKSDHERVGKGKLVLVDVVPQKQIVTGLDFNEMPNASAEFTFEEEKGEVEVTWSTMYRIGNNPVRRYQALFKTGTIRQTFQSGLDSLKSMLESR